METSAAIGHQDRSRTRRIIDKLIPKQWVSLINTRAGHFAGVFLLISFMVAGLLALVYVQISIETDAANAAVVSALINVFFMLLLIIGFVSWMFALSFSYRRMAQQETAEQTQRLMKEIEAHEKTDRELQEAKEQAEAANRAKSRYLTHMSHELRSPLNAIMGYSQLLIKDPTLSDSRRNALSVILRSSEHLSDLIEGFLDISKIEAGRLELVRNDVHFGKFLDQISNMFRVQAESKDIRFGYCRLTPLPKMVSTDERRLRQILINILSNAIKFTSTGSVHFSVKYRSQVAEFIIEDTGIGIGADDLDRIFKPFERIRQPGDRYISGTGLGLAITQLLVDMMGGDINIESTPGKGSRFTISLMLASSTKMETVTPVENRVMGYEGEPKLLVVVDDEPNQRNLLYDLLNPLGFHVMQAADGPACLKLINDNDLKPDAFLLDVSMPSMSGWELSARLHALCPDARILMISANANEIAPPQSYHNAYLVKPIQVSQLRRLLKSHLKLQWVYETPHDTTPSPLLQSTQDTTQREDNAEDVNINRLPLSALRSIKRSASKTIMPTPNKTSPRQTTGLTATDRDELIRMAKIGYVTGIRSRLTALAHDPQLNHELIEQLTEFLDTFHFSRLINQLESEK